MIGSLLSSVIPSSSFSVQDSDGNDAPAVRDAISTSLTRVDVTGNEDGGRRLGRGRHDFTHAAKHMIRDALKTFSHDLRDSFKDLGFKTDMVMRLAHDVMQAAKQALKSGADFTANLMMAVVTQTTTTSAAGSTSSFSMVASEIEITINQSTGSVQITATQVEIQSQMTIGAGSAMPLLVDFTDTDTDGDIVAPMLAMNDLESFLANDGSDAEAEAMGPVLASLPETAPVEGDDADPLADPDAVATEEGDGEVGATEDAGDIVPLPEVIGVAHIIITAFERYLNSEGEQITYIKLDAVIPLTTSPESIAEQVADEVIEEIVEPTEVPVAEQVIEEPVGQLPTLDLVA